ncbi:MAG: SRPBCC domain-containing protein [Paracoccaceae bacterium]|nr:SRPBCC domain-containing protein [Paracoccaceae bacterium]
MSILTTTAAIAATALVAAFGLGQITGPSIETEIEIDAAASAVWKELADTEAYADWNPFVRRISGNLEAGEYLQVTVGADGNSPMDFTPEVLVADANEELRWVGRLGFKGIFDGEHYFILEETDRGTTIFHHGETFTGLLGYPLIALIREDTYKGFLAMNEALKARTEANS